MVTKIEPVASPTPAQADWPAQGQWTYEDYLRLPDDDGKRYEIIDGVLYMANAPDFDHQFTVSELHLQMGLFVKEQKLGLVLTAPFEIHLPGIARPVQPDVFFIAAERQPRSGAKFFEGAPDLIIEVVSPGSVRLDRTIKFSAYERAGVREYWLADPRTHFIEVHFLSPDTQEYVMLGQFGPGEQVNSTILPNLALPVEGLFAPVGVA
jgi:Uma2 family endonuclease